MKFIKAGLQTSIQDLGRFGQMHLGIAHSGAMDPDSMKIANWLVNKPPSSAVIEICLIGPIIEFYHSVNIAICGAKFEVYLNEKEISNNQTIAITRGDVLRFGHLRSGLRAYLALSAEIDLPPVLASYSTHLATGLGGYKGRAFIDADELAITPLKLSPKKIIDRGFTPDYLGNYCLRCVSSVESNRFSERQISAFYSSNYRVNLQSNRMGVRLDADSSSLHNDIEIVSGGLTQGSIQIPPSGNPIISSVDGQTIGGYPRIANIISADLALVGQLKATDKISFVLVEQDFAMQVLQQKQKLLNKVLS